MGWILPPGGVTELTHTIARNLYSRPPKDLTAAEKDVVVAWVAGRAPVSEVEVRQALLEDWASGNDKGLALVDHQGGAPPPSSTLQTRSLPGSPLGVRLAQTQEKPATTTTTTTWQAEGKPLTLWEGASTIADRGTFDLLARKAILPGQGTVHEVKFIITGAAGGTPQLAFINTNAYEAHHAFAKGALAAKDSLVDFNGRAYFAKDRDVVCGSVVALPDQGFALQFLPTDPMTTSLVALSAQLIKERAPFLKDELVYQPTGVAQEDVAKDGAAALENAGVIVRSTDHS